MNDPTDDPQSDPWGDWKGRRLDDGTAGGWRCPVCERPGGHPLCAVSSTAREVCLLPQTDGESGD